ncbi:hypothetical protein [Streptomyces fractus]|uniref:hypothetical protein n=1 Tax=Streptomyces fractus TaxID=641806 RepID=UPI003CF9F665
MAADRALGVTGQPSAQPLNFVVVLTDDQGRWAMPHRMPELHMPHLARLQDDAVELDQFYQLHRYCSARSWRR